MFEDDRITDHLLFLRLMLEFTEQERQTEFHTMAYRKDTDGNSDSCETEQDGFCVCNCKYFLVFLVFWVFLVFLVLVPFFCHIVTVKLYRICYAN